MKIGHKLYVGTFTDLEYFNCAQWCNKNNAYMKDCRDKGFWETVINIPDEVKKKRAEIRKQISLLKGELL